MLDDEFLEAYEHGMVVKCGDGVTRRLYPRIFTYTADYPEKCASTQPLPRAFSPNSFCRVLLATVRDLGACPCPRCLTPKAQVPEMGTKTDSARRERLVRLDNTSRRADVALARSFIYEKGRNVDSTAVENMLKAESYVPTTVSF